MLEKKPRRKKKYLLLKGKAGNYIVGSREWYDSRDIGKKRGRNQMWVIAAQSDDREMLVMMGNLTDRYVGMKVRNEWKEA